MDALPPPAIHRCAPADQDVLLKVSGTPSEFHAFLKDIVAGNAGWVVVSDTHERMSRVVRLRVSARRPYWVIDRAMTNARYRALTTEVTYDVSRCSRA